MALLRSFLAWFFGRKPSAPTGYERLQNAKPPALRLVEFPLSLDVSDFPGGDYTLSGRLWLPFRPTAFRLDLQTAASVDVVDFLCGNRCCLTSTGEHVVSGDFCRDWYELPLSVVLSADAPFQLRIRTRSREAAPVRQYSLRATVRGYIIEGE